MGLFTIHFFLYSYFLFHYSTNFSSYSLTFSLVGSSGLSCPAADFVEETFLMAAKGSLSDQGLFVINLVSRSQAIKDSIYSKLKSVRTKLFLTRVCELHSNSQSFKECMLLLLLLLFLVKAILAVCTTFSCHMAYDFEFC